MLLNLRCSQGLEQVRMGWYSFRLKKAYSLVFIRRPDRERSLSVALVTPLTRFPHVNVSLAMKTGNLYIMQSTSYEFWKVSHTYSQIHTNLTLQPNIDKWSIIQIRKNVYIAIDLYILIKSLLWNNAQIDKMQDQGNQPG